MSKARGPGLIFHSENLDIHHKGSVAKGPVNTISKASQKKGGGGLGQRKPLQDISNKSSLRKEASTKKKNLPNEVTKERFQHDHDKCMASRKSEIDRYFDQHESLFPDTPSKQKRLKGGCASPPKYLELEPIPELEMSEMSWCHSPICSPPQSPLRFEPPEISKILLGSVAKEALNTFSKASQKKGARGLGQRKALQDISNKSSLQQEVSTKKKSLPSEGFNVAEERFLHDHEKCILSRKAEMNQYIDAHLFELEPLFPDTPPKPTHVKAGCACPPMYLELEQIPELDIPEMTWCCPPICSPPQSPLRFEIPEFVLKPLY